ncbi:MAG: DUF3237 domain-containing protein [Acidobacteria bacterium]|nr:DUF3237 domain-containing protein [Acidobacteriota bacterium]MCW5967960.1 DUF3237 domain-containing protein [Blastocatellales bacterium]
MAQSSLFPYNLEYLFSYTADLEKIPEVIGQTPDGILINFYVTGGTISGPKLSGTLTHGGGDWYTLREDGVGISNVRATFQTDDGALIYTDYIGIMDLGPDGAANFAKGQVANIVPLKTTPRYHTAHPQYAWLNRLQCLGVGQVDHTAMTVSYDVYAVM